MNKRYVWMMAAAATATLLTMSAVISRAATNSKAASDGGGVTVSLTPETSAGKSTTTTSGPSAPSVTPPSVPNPFLQHNGQSTSSTSETDSKGDQAGSVNFVVSNKPAPHGLALGVFFGKAGEHREAHPIPARGAHHAEHHGPGNDR